MKKIKILAIAPYSGLKEVFLSVSKEYENIEFDVYNGNLAKGLEIANDVRNMDYDAIISRGGTTMLIAQTVQKPVIDLKISAYDMLRIIKMTENYSGKKAIVGFSNIANCAHVVGELLNYPIDIFSINTENEVEQCLIRLKDDGYQLIIGDVVTLEMSHKMGMNGVLLTSGEECVRQAVDEAIEICRQQQRMGEETIFYKKLLEGCKENILVCDEEENIIFTNLKERNQTVEFAIKRLKSYNDQIKKKKACTVQFNEDGCLWNVFCRFIRIDDTKSGFVYYLRWQFVIDNTENEIFSVQNKDYNENYLYYIKAISAPRTIEQISAYARTMLPVLLIGEKGVGKSCAAYEMHQQSNLKDRPFITIDCKALNMKNIKATFSPENALFFDREGATVFLKDIDDLDFEVQPFVNQYLGTKKIANSFRFLASTKVKLEDLVSQGLFLKKLYDKCSELKLILPAFRDRKESIRNLSSLYLSKYNAQFGRHVVGIDDKAMKMLENYSWYGNAAQFNHVIKELVLMCKNSYISEEDTEQQLSAEDQTVNYRANGNISLKGSLDDIERRIVQQVLKEENMNQSKVASRLKISRSTIWRKLK